jgi:SAM-dependent methyltransferase
MNRSWWRDETFWRDIGPFLFSRDHMARAESETDEILDDLELEPGARILDVGCGPGRIMLPLARRGYAVTGLEICEQYRRQARGEAERTGTAVDVVAGDIFEFEAETGFDAVMDVFAVIGYHADPAWDVIAVRRMYSALRPGGELLIQARLPAATHGTLKHHTGTSVCVETRAWDRDTQTMTTRWTIVSRTGQRMHMSQLRVYGLDDLRGLLDFCGFEQVRGYESPGEERIVVVGQRPLEDRPFAGPDPASLTPG